MRAGAQYQWQLCTPKACARISIKGATKPTLNLVKSYSGKRVRVLVTRKGKTTASAIVTVARARRP